MTEMAIQQLLVEAGARDLDQDLVMVDPQGLEVAADWRSLRSPETYLGTARAVGSRPRIPSSTTARTSTREPVTCRSIRGTSPAIGRSPSTRPC